MGGLDGQGRGGSCRWWGADRRAGAVGGAGVRLPITGYDIIDADSLEAAKALCDGHPFVAGALADFSVDVYELTPSRPDVKQLEPRVHEGVQIGSGHTPSG